MNLRGRISCIVAGLICAGGCETTAPNTSASKPTTQLDALTRMTMSVRRSTTDDERDPRPQLSVMLHLDVYVLDVPAGAVSKNEDFWKRVDEQVLGIGDADRLNRNGLRCGLVPRSESLFFSQYFEKTSHRVAHSVVDNLHSSTITLDVGKKFTEQDLFFFNAQNQLQGRSYDAGVDEMTLAFSPTPRKPGSARLVFCPTVRSEKKHLQFTTLNEEYSTSVNEVDHVYDAGLSVDVPDDSFFILAPSVDAARPSSVGGSLLIKTDQAEQMEQVVLVMPTFIRMDGTPNILPGVLVKPLPTTTQPQSPAQ